MVYTLGYFMRWNRIALFALGVPVIAFFVALSTALESPVFLVAQNKVCFSIIYQVERFGLYNYIPSVMDNMSNLM